MRAGSALTTGKALRNLVAFTGHPVEDVLLLTSNVAVALRLENRKGSIKVGLDADFVLLDDALNVCRTIVSGRLVYQA